MPDFEPFEEGVEVNGRTVLSVIEGFPDFFEERGHNILERNGIENPDPDSWYPQSDWLKSFEEIQERSGEATLRQIGKAIPESADMPEVDTMVEAFTSMNDAYHMNHRGGEIGYYKGERVDDDTVDVFCRNPYPCPFDEGIVEGFADQFGQDHIVKVEETSDHCRQDGGEECSYRVEWL